MTRQPPPQPPNSRRICPECGNSVPPDAEFCPHCGHDMRPKRSRAWPIVLAALVALAAGVGIALLVADNGGQTTATVTAPGATTAARTATITVQTPTRTVTAPPRTTTVTVPSTITQATPTAP
jgi:ribosomal protein L40E